MKKVGESFVHFFIYSRKSVYTGKGESIENQIEMCKQYIETKFPDMIEKEITIYEDEGFSAKNTNRPQFQQMLRDIRTCKPAFIVCYRLDRISRNVSDFSALIENLNDLNIAFICIKEEFDTSKPMGKAMMYIASVFAQLERETIAERVRDNMLMLARTGRWLGGTTPTGFTSGKQQEIIVDGKLKTSCILKGNPEELWIIDIIFKKFLELQSISGVSKYLIQKNIKSRNHHYFSLLGIKEILQNPVYCTADLDAYTYFTKQHADVCFEEKDCSSEFGLLSYNKRDYKKKHAPRHSIDQWIIAKGRHKGCIPGEKWVLVQKIIADNVPTGMKPAKAHNDYSLLSGLIYCIHCGNRMFAKHRSASPDVFDYMCNSKLRGGKDLCDCQNINGQQADTMVFQFLMTYSEENSEIYPLLENLKHCIAHQTQNSPIDLINTQLKKCNMQIENLIQILAQNTFDAHFMQRLHAQVNELEHELSRLTIERAHLQENMVSSAHLKISSDMLAEQLSNLKNYASKISIHEKRAFIKRLTHKIVWDGINLHIYFGDT